MGSDEKYRRVKRALLGLLLAGCVVARPATPSLPDGFPADFPAPPQWSSALSRAELEAFYRAPHPGWRATGPGSAPPSLGPIALPSAVFLTHVSDGLAATIAIGIPNPIDSGTLVAVTIVPRRPLPSP